MTLDHRMLFVAAIGIAALVSYRMFPRPWARLLIHLERTRSGLRRRDVLVDGRRFSYLEGGAGFPIVLLHGFGGDKDHWTALSRRLVRDYRIIAPDVPGFGDSLAAESDGFLLRDQAARIRALLTSLGVNRYHLVGNSMGGHLAGILAHEYPDEVETLLLLEPHGIQSRLPSDLDADIRAGKAPLVPKTAAEFDHLVKLLFVRRPFLPGPIHRLLREQALASAALHERVWNDLWDPRSHLLEQMLPGIHAPALVIWGDSNRFLHVSATEKLEQRLPHCQVVKLAACGHAPMLEQPGEVARHFRAFLALHEGRLAAGLRA